MKDERLFWIVMSVQVHEWLGSEPAPDDGLLGFLPVFATEEQAKAYAGDRFTISAARIREPKP